MVSFLNFRTVSVSSSGSIIYFENKNQNAPADNAIKESDEPCRDFVTIIRSKLYPLPKYEAQEITTLFSDYADGS